jgi:signal peptidase I
MIPSLLIGDYLFVSKFSYGYSRHSLPFSLPLVPGRVFASEPERGDVAVFKLPTDGKTDYIKRIIGLPGDTIQLKDSILYVNGQAMKRDRIDDFVLLEGGTIRRIPRYLETLPNGRQYQVIEHTENTATDSTPVFKVPVDHYFTLGDNRDRSRDSRFLGEVGFVPRVNLVGRAEFLFFSVDGSVWEFWKWASSLRFKRMFRAIH